MFSKMFPDSKFAQKYQMHKSKLCYVVGYGLAPHYTVQLQKDAKDKLYCFHFDETTTSQIKKQYDGYATYKTNTGIVTTYFGSLFVGRCSAVKLKEHMFEFLKKHQLEISNLVSIGMDGPNVNHKFHSEVEDALAADGNRGLLTVGSCPIHIANNAFNKMLSTLSPFINLDQLASDLHGFFSKSAARRIEYSQSESITEISSKFMIRHVKTRWLSLEKVLVRVIEQWPNLKEYFLNTIKADPDIKNI